MWKKHPKYQVLFTELNPWQLPSKLTIIPNMSVSDIETQMKCMASYGFLSPFLLRLRFSSCEVQQFTFLTFKESGRCWNHHCQSCQNVRSQQRIAGNFPSNLSKWISNIHKLPQMVCWKKESKKFHPEFPGSHGSRYHVDESQESSCRDEYHPMLHARRWLNRSPDPMASERGSGGGFRKLGKFLSRSE